MPKHQKIAIEEKIEYVRAYLRGEITQGGISKATGVRLSSVQMWIKRYEAEGVDGFYTDNGNRVYSPETKTMAVLEYLNGKAGQLDICRKYKIRSRCQLQTWIKVYNAYGDLSSMKYSGGGSYMSKARSTTQEERLQIVQECLASDKNELGESGLEDRRGKRKKDQTPRTELEKAQIEIQKLKHQLYMAEMERDLLKKLNELERGEFLDK